MADSPNKKNRTGVAAVFWIVFALIILIAFLVKQDDIVRILKETDFFIYVFGSEPEFIANYEPQEKVDSVIVLTDESPVVDSVDSSDGASETRTLNDDLIGAGDGVVGTLEDSLGKIEDDLDSEKSLDMSVDLSMDQVLFFIVINSDGMVERKEIVRNVSKNNAPLAVSLTALLAGPDLSELEDGYISLIPKGTQLISVSVQDRSAVINFSEEFAFNTYGVEGYLGQLMQIVYTATAFSTIDSVQFLIDGQKSEYLGGEGVWIGTPLNRMNFK